MPLLAVFVVPLGAPEKWEQLRYKKIPSHEVSFEASGLLLDVKNSASPLVYPLVPSLRIKKITVSATLAGGLEFSPSGPQGEKGSDDFVLRVGLVEAGDRKLSWFERQVAPEWVLKLHALGPGKKGLKRVLFLNVASQNLDWKERVHPLSDLLTERIVARAAPEFTFTETFEGEGIETLGLWVSADADDLKQSYQLVIKEIRIETNE